MFVGLPTKIGKIFSWAPRPTKISSIFVGHSQTDEHKSIIFVGLFAPPPARPLSPRRHRRLRSSLAATPPAVLPRRNAATPPAVLPRRHAPLPRPRLPRRPPRCPPCRAPVALRARRAPPTIRRRDGKVRTNIDLYNNIVFP
jgi:hypothetical protein